jgi:aldehyde:ferredoxin oxidoreductase
MPGGYMGKVLRVDLNSKKVKTEHYDETTLRKYVGGSGLGAKILYEETDKNTDPLGENNPLIFMTGPMTGTNSVASGRSSIIAKSPLTNIWGESSVGGRWGTNLKQAGYDGVIITGKSEKPVYIWINEEKVDIRKADHVWGKDTYEADGIIREETDRHISVASIGQAGEKTIRIAGIMVGGKEGRTAGRCGMGAVMGSKNLKAVVVNGSKHPVVSNKTKLMQAVKETVLKIKPLLPVVKSYGTPMVLLPNEAAGDLPVKNWQLGGWKEKVNNISAQTIADTILVGNAYCAKCVIGCGRKVKVTKGPFAPVDGAGPEYQTLAMLGSNCLIDNVEAIAKGNELCNRYGIDTISTGSAIAFAMEAYEKGLIDKKDTGGISLEWGNPESMIGMIHQIGNKEYLGELLGKGVKTAAETIGGEALLFSFHTKGLPLPAHDPRAAYGISVAYATSNRGGCHLQAYEHDFELDGPEGPGMPDLGFTAKDIDRFKVSGKGVFVAKMQNAMCMFDTLCMCKFVTRGGITVSQVLDWFNYITGWDVSFEEFIHTGESLYNLKRLYNVRCGISRKDDTLPDRIMTLAAEDGGRIGKLPPLNEMLDEYYEYRGWDEQGIPLPGTLSRLGINI